MKFTATIEYTNRGQAIVALFDSTGEWACASRVEVRSGGQAALYEAGYARASQAAAIKGGSLERYSEAE